MTFQESRFTLAGRQVPVEAGAETIPAVSITLKDDSIEISLLNKARPVATVRAFVWEHTLYELELLRFAIESACSAETSGVQIVSEQHSWIGPGASFPIVASVEVGFCGLNSNRRRAYCFCGKLARGREAGNLVLFAVGIGRSFRQIVISKELALEFSSWLQDRINLIAREVFPDDFNDLSSETT